MWSNFLADTLWCIPQSIIGIKDGSIVRCRSVQSTCFGEKVRERREFLFCCVGYKPQQNTRGVNKILQYYTAILLEAYFDVDVEVFYSVL